MMKVKDTVFSFFQFFLLSEESTSSNQFSFLFH